MYKPENPQSYNKPQHIVSSGRILFNAKDDGVFIFARKTVGISSAGTINLDSDEHTIINAPKIYLGLDASEPLLLGNQSVNLLKELIEKIDLVSEQLSILTSLPPGAPFIPLNKSAASLSLKLKELNTRLETLKSKQNYTI